MFAARTEMEHWHVLKLFLNDFKNLFDFNDFNFI